VRPYSLEPTEKRNCPEQLEWHRSALHQRQASHSEHPHSDSAHSRQAQSADLMLAVRVRRRQQHPAAEEAPQAELCWLLCRQAGQQLATPVIEAAGALLKERGQYKELQTTKIQLDASTHQSLDQYPSLCALQQRGSFQSRVGGSAFMVNHPSLAELTSCPARGYISMRAQSSGLDEIAGPANTMIAVILRLALLRCQSSGAPTACS